MGQTILNPKATKLNIAILNMHSMNFEYMKSVIPTLEKYVDLFGGKIIPCTEEEVNQLESLIPAPYHLPAAYKEFLLFCGKSLGKVYNYRPFMQYNSVVSRLQRGNTDTLKTIRMCNENAELYPDMLVFTWHDHMYFDFIRVGEGENPPVYFWSEEEDEDEIGLEAAKVRTSAFTDFVELLICTPAKFALMTKVDEQLNQKQAPKGQQFWIPFPEEKEQGIVYREILQRVGFRSYQDLDNAANWCGKSSVEYLEELSGWKALKVGDEVRFFPPSYESPEEKNKKVLEQQSQLEEQKQELAKVEKIIANLQNRIKNLLGGKLTGGINFKNTSASRIKELEKELRKQKIVKQKLEKESIKLEENIN